MNASIYTINNGKSTVYQLGNTRAIRHSAGVLSEGVQWRYEKRANSKAEWVTSHCAMGYDTFVAKVQAAC